MSAIYLVDYYANNLDSPMHRASVNIKMISFVVTLGAIIFDTLLQTLILQFFLIIGFQIASRLSIKHILLWALYPTFFAALFAVSQALYSLEMSIQTLLRAVNAALLMLLLVNTTSYTRIIPLIEKVSKTLSNLAFFSYRFFFLFVDESEKRLNVFRVRGGLQGSLANKIRNIAKLMGLLFVSYLDSGERVYDAVKTRSYKGMFSAEAAVRKRVAKDDCAPILLAVLSTLIFLVGTARWM
jgi:cobalt/nickel transport system permease protein